MQRCEKVKTSRYDDPRKPIQGKNLGRIWPNYSQGKPNLL